MKKLLLFGGTGMIGSRILKEALSRGYQVTGVVREPGELQPQPGKLDVTQGNVLSAPGISRLVDGHDVVISAFGPGNQPELIVDAANALVQAMRGHGSARVIAVGGAGSLEVAPGKQLVDTPAFPEAWKGLALAHRDALAVFRKAEGVNWTSVCPSALIEPGERTGKYRTAADKLITDEKGDSRISAEDFAVAILDEVESPKYERQRFTVGY